MDRVRVVVRSVALSALCAAALAAAGASAELGRFAAKFPDFTLKDPSEKEHAKQELVPKGVVVILTIPNVKHGDIQSRWSRWLTAKGWSDEWPRLVMLQDLSQSNVKDKALEGMKKKFKPDRTPLLLIDYTGDARRQFRVGNDETVVLVYDRQGALVHVEAEEPTPEAAQRIRNLVDKMR